MKPALKPEFHALCSSEMKASAKFLFGEDLAKQVRDVKETHRIGNTVGSSNSHSRVVNTTFPNLSDQILMHR